MEILKKIRNNVFNICAVLIIFAGILIRIIAFNNNIYDIVLDDCHSLAGFYNMSFKECFTVFTSGANFLPLYKFILLCIYKVSGFNFYALKLPSLIASIFILPVSFILLKKIFNNRLIILSILIILVFNYNLIFFQTKLKPYDFDVLITLLILNAVMSLEKDIPLKKIFKYAAAAIPLLFLSIPSIVLTELYWFIIYIKNAVIKNKKNIINLLIFQAITIPFIIAEYVLYISQIKQDNGLKDQWTDDLFYFAPKSLEAVNALIQFIYFHFFWWDTVNVPSLHKYTILTALLIFTAGSIICIVNSIKNKNLKDVYLVLPVFVFLGLSYLNIYPFCNRLVTFLIPVIIFITFKPFDIKCFKVIMSVFVLLYLGLFIKYAYNQQCIQNLMFNDYSAQKVISVINALENTNPDNEIIITSFSPCTECLETDNIVDISEFVTTNNKPQRINFYDKIKKALVETSDIKTIINNKEYVYFATAEGDVSTEKELIEQAVLRQGYEVVDEKESSFFNYKLFKKI